MIPPAYFDNSEGVPKWIGGKVGFRPTFEQEVYGMKPHTNVTALTTAGFPITDPTLTVRESALPRIIRNFATGVEVAACKKLGPCHPRNTTATTTSNTAANYGFEVISNDQITGYNGTMLSFQPHKTLIKDGQFITSSTEGVVNKARLLVPVLSGICGHLIPQAAWKLVPAKALANT